MTEDTPAAPPAEPVVHRRKGPSAIWLVPVLAAVVGAWVWVDAIRSRGPIITIEFESADGLQAGQTHVRYKSVDVGDVHSVDLRPDLTGVLVQVRMHPHTEALLREDTRFWIVRPRIGLEGVSGLETLLSGAYIAVDPGPSGATTNRFVALAEPPQTPADAPGLKFTLTAAARGSVDVGSPILHHGVVVGRIEGLRLLEREAGDTLQFDAWVEARYADHVYAGSRFWNASGLELSFGAEGMRLSSASLTTLLNGGVEFDTPPDDASAGRPAAPGSVFHVWRDRAAAHEVPMDEREFVLYFDGSVRGLVADAPVEFRGLRVGRVRDFALDTVRGREVLTRVRIALEPARFGSGTASESVKLGASAMAAAGYRARIATASLITGGTLIELLQVSGQPHQLRGRPQDPELPTVDSAAQQLADAIDTLPRVMANVEELTEHLATITSQPGLMQLGTELTTTLRRADATLAAVQALLSEQSAFQLRSAEALDQLAAAMRSLRELTDMLERQPEALLRGKDEP